jgi:Tfp pilus assembly protein FimT
MRQLLARSGSRQVGCKGLTFIELLTTLILLLILTIVGVPFFNNTLQIRRLSGATQKLVSELRYLQSVAVTQDGLFRFHSGTDPGVNRVGQYRLEQSTDGGTFWNGISAWTELSREFPGSTFSIQDTSAAPVHEIRFNSKGAIANPAGLTYPLRIQVSGTPLAGNKTIEVRLIGSVRIL